MCIDSVVRWIIKDMNDRIKLATINQLNFIAEEKVPDVLEDVYTDEVGCMPEDFAASDDAIVSELMADPEVQAQFRNILQSMVSHFRYVTK